MVSSVVNIGSVTVPGSLRTNRAAVVFSCYVRKAPDLEQRSRRPIAVHAAVSTEVLWNTRLVLTSSLTTTYRVSSQGGMSTESFFITDSITSSHLARGSGNHEKWARTGQNIGLDFIITAYLHANHLKHFICARMHVQHLLFNTVRRLSVHTSEHNVQHMCHTSFPDKS